MADSKLVFDVLAKASGEKDLNKLGKALDGVGKSADDLGKKKPFAALITGAKDAGASISNAFRTARTEADHAGKGIGTGLLKGVGGAFVEITKQAASAGKTAATSLASGISSGLESLGPGGPYAGAAIFAGILAAAPIAGAAIAGALIAGVASVGLGAAIALQFKDPEVAKAGQELGNRILDSLKNATAPFKAEVLGAIGAFDVAWLRSSGNVERMFSNLRGLLVPFTQQVGQGMEALTRGLADVTSQAGPVLDALGSGAQQLLTTVGQGLSLLKDNGAEAATALNLVFTVLSQSLGGLFTLVNGLTEAFGLIAKTGALGPGVAASYDAWKASLDGSKSSMDALGTSTQTTTSLMQEQTNALRAQTDPVFGLMNAQRQAKEAQDAYNTAVKTHGVNSAEATAAQQRMAESAVQLQGAVTTAADAGFDGKLTPALRAAMSAAGYSKEAIDAFERSTMASKRALDGWEGTYTARVVTVFEQINKPFTTSAGKTGIGGNNFTGHRWGGIDHHMAAGGTLEAHYARSPTVLYGERSTGGEAFIPKHGNTRRSRAIVEQVAEKWLGGRVSWDGNQAVTPAPSHTSGAPGFGTVLAELRTELRALRHAYERGGDVYLDNRKVGSIGGREANLFSRAG